MIVTCSSCQTRFRASPDKVGPNGARIRCSRCEAVFVVVPEAGAAPPPPAPVPRAGPPPLPARRPGVRATAPNPAAIRADPFAAPPAAPAPADPFALEERPAPRSAAPSPPPDPFTAELAVPAGQDDPFGLDLGLDPFGVASGEPAAGGSSGASARVQRATADLAKLLGAPEEARSGPASLALEEREPARRAPRSAPSLDEGGDGGAQDDAMLGPGLDGMTGLVEVPRTLAEVAFAAGLNVPAPSPPAAAPAERRPPALVAAAVHVSPRRAFPRDRRIVSALANSLSLALLLAAAAGLFLAWRGGLGARVAGALEHAAPAPLTEAAGVTAGLYDTAAGSPVLVVRGQVAARAAVAGPVRVRVEVVAAGRTVAAAEGLAGATATAEEVFGAGEDGPAASLRRALDRRAAMSLAPGARTPFLVLFPPPAPETRGAWLRVSTEPASSAAR